MSDREPDAPGDARRGPDADRHAEEGHARATRFRHEAEHTRDAVRAKAEAAVATAEAAAAEMERELQRRIDDARVRDRRRR